ncbi:hypothetical protein O9X90_25735 [Agrobacterium leguminum]|uniref:hypothetical protein n=1 Tax=Agrobacterium leguminum TaxID=2792015 RepID=UPI0022B839AC|nr:hypothetical protein [Agrobacterium leguminum]MCZ7935733.1 hypothetical protein [Agrobacterium leguminum]
MPNSLKKRSFPSGLAAATLALLLSSCSGSPSIEGKYRAEDRAGATAEFLSDGTLIFVSGGKQGVWSWTKLNDSRLKLAPGGGLVGTQPAICTYALSSSELRLANCHLAMTLTRL